jgi:hypothetical protein
MDYKLTKHARDAMNKRKISAEWLERTLSVPKMIQPDAVDPELEHRLAAIPENENRVLRVIVNTQTNPERVVTMYFDRNMRGKL